MKRNDHECLAHRLKPKAQGKIPNPGEKFTVPGEENKKIFSNVNYFEGICEKQAGNVTRNSERIPRSLLRG